jgi:cytoskeletal protein CcmA (bactofilin family)
VHGTVYVWDHGQGVQVDGRVGGEVRASGAAVALGPSAVVGRDVTVWSGSLRRAPGAQVGGSVREFR